MLDAHRHAMPSFRPCRLRCYLRAARRSGERAASASLLESASRSHLVSQRGVVHGIELCDEARAFSEARLEMWRRVMRGAGVQPARVDLTTGNAFRLTPAPVYDGVYVAAGAEEADIPYFLQFAKRSGVVVVRASARSSRAHSSPRLVADCDAARGHSETS